MTERSPSPLGVCAGSIIRVSGKPGPHAMQKAIFTTALIGVVLVTAAFASAKPQAWTPRQVEKAVVAKVIIRCPTADLYHLGSNGSAEAEATAAKWRAWCAAPAQPVVERGIVACGVSPRCNVGPFYKAVDEGDLQEAQVKILWHDKGQGIRRAVCRRSGTRFVCAVQLKNGLDHGLSIPLNNRFACLAVTATGSTFRWKDTYLWDLGSGARSPCRSMLPGS